MRMLQFKDQNVLLGDVPRVPAGPMDKTSNDAASKAASRAGTLLNDASEALRRLDQVHASIAASLERSEERLVTVEAVVQELGQGQTARKDLSVEQPRKKPDSKY